MISQRQRDSDQHTYSTPDQLAIAIIDVRSDPITTTFLLTGTLIRSEKPIARRDSILVVNANIPARRIDVRSLQPTNGLAYGIASFNPAGQPYRQELVKLLCMIFRFDIDDNGVVVDCLPLAQDGRGAESPSMCERNE